MNKNLLQNIKILFLIRNITLSRNGLKLSVLRKTKIIEDFWQYKPIIVTKEYNLNLRQNIKSFAKEGLLNPDSTVVNMYEYFLKADLDRPEVLYNRSEQDLAYKEVAHNSFRVFKDDKLIRTDVYNQSKNILKKSTCFNEAGYINKVIFYDTLGYMSKVQLFNNDAQLIQEQFFCTEGKCRITFDYHVKDDGKSEPNEICLYDDIGNKIKMFKTDIELFIYFIDIITADENFRYVVMSEAMKYGDVVLSLKNKAIIKTAVLHDVFSKKTPNAYSSLCHRLKEYDGVVVLTEDAKKDLENIAGRYDNIYVIPHAYHCPIVKADFEKRNLNKVVAIARFSMQKRLDLAIRIFEKVINKIPDAIFEIYGFGSEEKKLQDLIKTLKLENNVFIMGPTNDPINIFSKYALSLFTSKHEGFGLTILESIASGCPVIAYDIKYGPNEIIENGVNGYLFPFNNIDDFADKTVELLRDKNKLYNLSENSYAVTMSKFDIKSYLDRWFSFLETLLIKEY